MFLCFTRVRERERVQEMYMAFLMFTLAELLSPYCHRVGSLLNIVISLKFIYVQEFCSILNMGISASFLFSSLLRKHPFKDFFIRSKGCDRVYLKIASNLHFITTKKSTDMPYNFSSSFFKNTNTRCEFIFL